MGDFYAFLPILAHQIIGMFFIPRSRIVYCVHHVFRADPSFSSIPLYPVGLFLPSAGVQRSLFLRGYGYNPSISLSGPRGRCKMIPHRFIPFASALSVFSQVCGAQTITLTTHVSACSATYTSGTSTTVIQSTVTVQPTPWTDTVANSGAPFVIRLEQTDISGYPDQDGAAPYWLTANGNTTTNSSLAAVYFINEGRMSLLNGSHIAANFNVVDQAFGVTNYPMPINTTFSVRNRMLNWTNPLFSNGTAQFYKLPPGLLDNALILAKFLGPMEAQRSWSPVVLWVEPSRILSYRILSIGMY